MKVYQFIKYNGITDLNHFRNGEDGNTVFCFDLEDSVQDCADQFKTPALKSKHRNYVKDAIHKSIENGRQIKAGIRINRIDSGHYVSDIDALSDIGHISSIFLPKANHADQILDLLRRLNERRVQFDEIIPVIETKKGLDNLEAILKINSDKIKSVAFGHCDYNLDNGIYPFYHQDSREYWNWVIKIYSIIKTFHLNLVNSPFLQLNNDSVFNDMLSVLYSVCGDHFGQITLTRRQSELCYLFSPDNVKTISERVPNPLTLKVPESYADEFIRSFEVSDQNKGFALTPDRVILSPHEYQFSMLIREKKNLPEINFTFVGGCFPVKGNVLFEDRFHQLIKKEVESKYDVRFSVNIIRYERYMNCLNRILSYAKSNAIDILVFSIRPEPFLRLVKFYYKYFDDTSGKIRWSINLPFLNRISPEKFDLLASDTRFHPIQFGSKSVIRKAFINLNYILGLMLGNDHFSLKEYVKLVREIMNFTEKNNIPILILGPAIRTNTIMEKILSRKLDFFFRKSLNLSPDQFISGSDLKKDGETLFEKNGVFVNEKYHRLVAERMGRKIIKIIDLMRLNEQPLLMVEEKAANFISTSISS